MTLNRPLRLHGRADGNGPQDRGPFGSTQEDGCSRLPCRYAASSWWPSWLAQFSGSAWIFVSTIEGSAHAARKMRQQSWGKGMVLFALTGWGQEDDREKSRDAGFNDHLVKPVDYNALTQRLAELRLTPD